MKLFVWDFHGVLEKGNDKVVRQICQKVLKKYGVERKFTAKQNHDLNGKKLFEYFEFLLPNESHETHMKLQSLYAEINADNSHIMAKNMKINDYAMEVLNKIAAKHQQILISNTRLVALENFVRLIKIESFFNSENMFAANAHFDPGITTKKEILKKILAKRKFDSIVCIGDSPDDMFDIDGIKSVKYLYARKGYSFKECQADYKIRDLRMVLREI